MKAESDQDKCESEKSNTPEAQQSSIKDPKPKGDVMDVFKQVYFRVMTHKVFFLVCNDYWTELGRHDGRRTT